MREFIILPRAFPPLYLINTKSFPSYIQGLKLYGSYSIKSRIKKTIVVGLYPLLKFLKKEIPPILFEKITIIQEVLNKLFQSENFYYNIYIPSWSKAVVQIVLPSGQVRGVLKISFDEKGQKRLVREQEALKLLENYNFTQFEIPKILDSGKISEYINFILFSSPDKYVQLKSFKLTSEIIEISAEIFSARIYFTELRNFGRYKNITQQILKCKELGLKEKKLLVKELEKYGHLKIPVGISHYDFKIWNMIRNLVSKKLFLYDWEDYRFKELPLFDLFSFTLFTYVTMNYKISPFNLYKVYLKLLPLFKQYLNKIGFEVSKEVIDFLLKIYLLDLISNEDLWNRWEKNEERPSIIFHSLSKFLSYIIETGG